MVEINDFPHCNPCHRFPHLPNLGLTASFLRLSFKIAFIYVWKAFTSNLQKLWLLEIELRLSGMTQAPLPTKQSCQPWISSFIFIYVLECFGGMYVYATCACSAHRGQKRAMGPLELEIRDNGFSLHASAGNLSLGPLQDFQVLLVAEPSLQSSEQTLNTWL